jgi:putative SOS response-associated peptidase YedK
MRRERRATVAFAGICRMEWRSRHQGKPGRGQPSALWLPDDRVERQRRADLSEGEPVTLTTEEECDMWMCAPWDEAGKLQRPLPNTMLRIVASGEREDPPSEAAQAQPSLPP